jgi:lipopolysaccharide biosynthesis regulator YciM
MLKQFKMKRLGIVFIFLCFAIAIKAQDAATFYETGKKFLVQGDLDNATMVLKKAVSMEPTNATYLLDLTTAYFYKEDFKTAKEYADKLLVLDDATDFAFYLSANIYRALEDEKNAEKLVRKGLKKYDNSGLLYEALGQVLGSKNDPTAIVQWEMGIKKDPTYAGNYYEAARFNFFSKTPIGRVWSIYYGEIFINLESNSTRTIELKQILLDSYKSIIADEDFGKKPTKNDFENLFFENFNKVKNVVATGVTTESLIKLRTLFIFNWFTESTVIQNSLYSRMQQLLREGYFEEYNYWIFEPVQNLASFENWLKTNQGNFEQFMRFHQNKLFKMTKTEYLK